MPDTNQVCKGTMETLSIKVLLSFSMNLKFIEAMNMIYNVITIHFAQQLRNSAMRALFGFICDADLNL